MALKHMCIWMKRNEYIEIYPSFFINDSCKQNRGACDDAMSQNFVDTVFGHTDAHEDSDILFQEYPGESFGQ